MHTPAKKQATRTQNLKLFGQNSVNLSIDLCIELKSLKNGRLLINLPLWMSQLILSIYFSTGVSFKGYNGSEPFNCQILNTNTAATVSQIQETERIIPATGLVCQ